MTFQGSLQELPLPDIIQLVSVGGKTGMFDLSHEGEAGEIYLRDGQIVHARAGELEGEEAVYELAIWPAGQFVFKPGEAAPKTTIEKSNTNLLMEAARRIDEWQVLSKRIPSTRLIPVFTSRDASTSVSFTPQEWAIICKIDERRSIEAIAAGVGLSPFEACKLLYGLITSGLVELKEELVAIEPQRLQKMTAADLERLSERIHQEARTLLAGNAKLNDLEATYRLCRSELGSGRAADAVLDLIRNEEKVVSSGLGPLKSKDFLQRIAGLVAAP